MSSRQDEIKEDAMSRRTKLQETETTTGTPEAGHTDATAAVAPIQPPPSHDEVARRAYELFVERGCEEGRDLEDWLRAEVELSQRRG